MTRGPKIVTCALTALAMGAPTVADAARKLTVKRAEAAVERKVGQKFDAVTADCRLITNRRAVCEWIGVDPYGGPACDGPARVTQHSRGLEVRYSVDRC